MNRDVCKKCRFAIYVKAGKQKEEWCLGGVGNPLAICKDTVVPFECVFVLEQLMSGEKVKGI